LGSEVNDDGDGTMGDDDNNDKNGDAATMATAR